eukprot:1119671-Rhodomonas_salina.1
MPEVRSPRGDHRLQIDLLREGGLEPPHVRRQQGDARGTRRREPPCHLCRRSPEPSDLLEFCRSPRNHSSRVLEDRHDAEADCEHGLAGVDERLAKMSHPVHHGSPDVPLLVPPIARQ